MRATEYYGILKVYMAGAFVFLAIVNLIHSACAETVSIDDFCKMLSQYKQAPGVEYTPGVAADGHFIAPADLPGQGQLRQFETIEIPVVVDLIKKFNCPFFGFKPPASAGKRL